MKQFFTIICALLFLFSLTAFAQIPTAALVQIVRSEDELRYDKTLENLMKNAAAKIRARAALAAGRIRKEAAIPALVSLLENDKDDKVRATAAFALGELESVKAADVILKILGDIKINPEIRARAIEAAGKIAEANAKDEKAKALSDRILQTLEIESKKRAAPDFNIISLGLTAVLRARPTNGAETTVLFTKGYSPQIRANALNTLARLRAKNANENARELLQKDADAVVRANAARILGAAEDKEAFDILLRAATSDADSRVRVSAIRSLAGLKDARSSDALMNRAGELLKNFAMMKTSVEYPKEKSEILEIFTTLGRLLANSNNKTAISLLESFRLPDNFSSPETEIAYARISPSEYLKNYRNSKQKTNWRTTSALAQGLGELATHADENIKAQARKVLLDYFTELVENVPPAQAAEMTKAVPDLLTALAAFKPDNLDVLLREMIAAGDVQVRVTAAGILAEQPAAKVNVEALKTAFAKSLLTDKQSNDAQLAILDALYKLDKSASVGAFLLALNA
ncbi:MAG: HEAT repeat domain-containing protein, partial [Pyrinomonadaceae bacterium]